MKKLSLLRFTFSLPILAVTAAMIGSQATSAAQTPNQVSNPMNTIEGVWAVTRHGVNCQTGQEVSTFPALMTFHQDGTVNSQVHSPASTNAYGPAEHGV